MITNFEHITRDLTADEARLLPIIISVMKAHRGNLNAITGKEICSKVSGLTEPRLRKLVNFIRTNGILPVIATSNGYYTADTVEEVQKQIQSLNDRIAAISAARDGLMKFVNNK